MQLQKKVKEGKSMKKEEGTKDWIFKFTTALGSVLAAAFLFAASPLSVGASGNLATPSSSRVTPFTSIQQTLPFLSVRRKSNLESPKVFSGEISERFPKSKSMSLSSPAKTSPNLPPARASPTILFGAWESIFMRTTPRPHALSTAMREYLSFLFPMAPA